MPTPAEHEAAAAIQAVHDILMESVGRIADDMKDGKWSWGEIISFAFSTASVAPGIAAKIVNMSPEAEAVFDDVLIRMRLVLPDNNDAN